MATLRYRLAELRQRFRPAPAIAQALVLLDHCDDLFGHLLMWPDVKWVVRRGLIMSGTLGRRLLMDEAKATRLIFDLIARHATKQIAYGQHHIYRGVLSLQGQSYRDITETALSWLNEYDWLDYEEYQEKLEALDEFVKSAG